MKSSVSAHRHTTVHKTLYLMSHWRSGHTNWTECVLIVRSHLMYFLFRLILFCFSFSCIQVNMLMKEQEAVAQSVRTRDTELALLLLAQGEAQPARKEGDEEAAASEVELVKEGAHI